MRIYNYLSLIIWVSLLAVAIWASTENAAHYFSAAVCVLMGVAALFDDAYGTSIWTTLKKKMS